MKKQNNKTINHHNNLFIKIMSNKDTAVKFMDHFLPEHLLDIIDLNTLELFKTDLYDESLNAKCCDLLYKVEFNHQAGFLVVNLEHQSKAVKLMPVRQLIYKLMAAEQVMASTDLDHLPVIYGMTFYHDAHNRVYPYTTDVFDLFGEHSELAKRLLFEPFNLIDVNNISDEALIALNEFGYILITHQSARFISPS